MYTSALVNRIKNESQAEKSNINFLTRAILEEAFTNPVTLVRKKLMIFVVYDEMNYTKQELQGKIHYNDTLMYYVP